MQASLGVFGERKAIERTSRKLTKWLEYQNRARSEALTSTKTLALASERYPVPLMSAKASRELGETPIVRIFWHYTQVSGECRW